MRSPQARLLAMLALCAGAASYAGEPPEGDWMLELTGEGPRIIGMLSLRRSAEGWQGHVEGGPIDVDVDGDGVRFVIDSRDLQGFTFNRVLTGTLGDATMSGSFEIEGATYDGEPGGRWTAVPKPPDPPRRPPAPADLSGTWQPAPGIDFRKYSMDLTPTAEEWFAGYLMHYDQPNVRCVSPGIVAMVAWGGYPMEILADDDRVTFIYEVESEVRRVFLDGRQPPEYYPTSPMGWSTGYWDGSDLVVETQLIEGNVRDFRGEPVSNGAGMHERYSLSEDGRTLSAVITLLDPANYRVPPIRRRQWTKSPETVIYPYECDPDSFYRQMYNEGKLDMYFERSLRRQMN
jgi:hypothetical protein